MHTPSSLKRSIALAALFVISVSGCLSSGNGGGDPQGIEPIPRTDGARQIAATTSGSLQNPAWSPDGHEVLFSRFVSGYNAEPADLLIIDIHSGEERTLVSDGSGNINLPGSIWSAETGQIVFASTRDPHDEIFVIDAEAEPGAELRITDRDGFVAYEPSFSPNGEWIVFESHVLDVEENGVIMKYRLDHSQDYIPLTDARGDARQPNWSPQGDLIVFQRYVDGQWDLWVMDVDGDDQRQVTSGTGSKTDASFSPNGDWLVYSSDEGDLQYANLFVISVQGGEPIRLTNYRSYDGAPSWSPDGTLIAFESIQGEPDGSPGTSLWVIETPQTVR